MTLLELLNKVSSEEIDKSKVKTVRIGGQIYDATGLLDKETLDTEVELLDKYNNVLDWKMASNGENDSAK